MIESYKNRLYKDVNSILTPEIREFTKDVLDHAPEKFWVMPASSTGKYHRPEEVQPGGLALHTIKCVEICRHLITMYGNLTVEEQSILVAGAILHDIYKNGIEAESEHTRPEHALLVRKMLAGEGQIDPAPSWLNKLLLAIEAHMGRWSADAVGQPIQPPDTMLGKMLHIADYFSSRKNILIEI